eukprot:6194989-Pleurochrysis_carterae.AAC.1
MYARHRTIRSHTGHKAGCDASSDAQTTLIARRVSTQRTAVPTLTQRPIAAVATSTAAAAATYSLGCRHKLHGGRHQLCHRRRRRRQATLVTAFTCT